MSTYPKEQTFSASESPGLKNFLLRFLPHLVTLAGTAPQPATSDTVTDSSLIVIIDG